MTTKVKADKAAANRILTAAVKRAVEMTRAGDRDAVVALLVAAGTAADMLLDEAS